MYTYDTLVTALEDLRKRGFTLDFNLKENCIMCGESIKLQPEQFEIEEVYRFEGDTNPSDSSILYAISSYNGEYKGVLVNAYGMYADPMSQAMVSKLSIQH